MTTTARIDNLPVGTNIFDLPTPAGCTTTLGIYMYYRVALLRLADNGEEEYLTVLRCDMCGGRRVEWLNKSGVESTMLHPTHCSKECAERWWAREDGYYPVPIRTIPTHRIGEELRLRRRWRKEAFRL